MIWKCNFEAMQVNGIGTTKGANEWLAHVVQKG